MLVAENATEEPILPNYYVAAKAGFSIAAYVKSGLFRSYYVPSVMDLPCGCAVTELVLLFEVGVWPPHDGVRRMA